MPNAAHAGHRYRTRRRTVARILMNAPQRKRSKWEFIKEREKKKPPASPGAFLSEGSPLRLELWPATHGGGVIPDERIAPVFKPDDYRTRFAAHEAESVANAYSVPGKIRDQAGITGRR